MSSSTAAAAFVSPSPLLGAARSANRSASSTRPRARGRGPVVLSMASGATDSIDFSAVDLASAGKSYAGMVFTPDTESAPVTRADLNWTQELADAINEQINVEYTASYAYHAVWAYFDRDTVALPGFAKYFAEQSLEERTHAEEFMKYQNKRGGQVVFNPVAVPQMAFNNDDGAADALYAMDLHLQLEKFVYAKLKKAHDVAEKVGDPQMMDMLEGYLGEQVDAVKKAADFVAQIKRVGTGHGVYHIDRVLLEDATA